MEMLDRAEQLNEEVATPNLPNEELPGETPEDAECASEEDVTRESLLKTIEMIVADDSEIVADDVARIKQQFYTLHNELTLRRKDEAGEEGEAFTDTEDPIEERFKAALAAIKEKKARQRAEIETRQAANLDKKEALINELKTLGADTDNVNRHYQRIKEIQSEFKEIGEVPPQNATAIWKNYQDAVESFYDQWKVNKELRDYDFKKNLAEKQLLLDEARKLTEEEDVITAFRRLQSLHDKWREIGPVAKDVREEIWTSFKDASAEINKKYQAHFEERKARERENEEIKTALCERIEALDFSKPSTYQEWDAMTKTILEAQEEWKKAGFAPRKTNTALFNRFRALCDDFFGRKSEFFKKTKNEFAENLAKKTSLCEKAEALAESTDWKKTTDAIVELQKEWKTIGPVARKHSDAIWRRFIKACDTFFDRKKKVNGDTRRAEQANLATKREIISRLNVIASDENTTPREQAIAEVQQLRKQWQETGHVPFKEKDKLQDAYREVVGTLFDKLDIKENRARMADFQAGIEASAGDSGKLSRERERLVRACEQRRQELKTYENNMGFFNSKSKNGDSIVREMERKMQHLKEEIAQISEKIKIIDSNI
ncbi:DUF349 domain-containing protein [Paramuribaculum intestinale]|uniref:DUF349 domain-containing protein n=1 Tax=Paramuribaculum intestinale TaxID=2094151 RepID=UPI0027302685|nr:DUF349 domain-containing protein [Paramuribaculum intestinale]